MILAEVVSEDVAIEVEVVDVENEVVMLVLSMMTIMVQQVVEVNVLDVATIWKQHQFSYQFRSIVFLFSLHQVVVVDLHHRLLRRLQTHRHRAA